MTTIKNGHNASNDEDYITSELEEKALFSQATRY